MTVVLAGCQRDAPEHLKIAKTLADARDVERSTRLSPLLARHRGGGPGCLRRRAGPAAGQDV